MASRFDELVGQITQIGYEHHAATLLENSRRNACVIASEASIRSVAREPRRVLIASAGPSLYRQRLLQKFVRACDGAIRRGDYCVVATDGAYIQCLKAGITPDWVVTIDPHPTRIVRWFGDHDLEQNERQDDYFQRQDLDMAMRGATHVENAKNIGLVDANKSRLVICSAAPSNVVERTKDFERYWFAPLVDDPESDGLTAKLIKATSLPALTTGGTVGTCAWAFAHCILKSRDIAVVGMDFGYPIDTPFKNTQEWNLTGGDPDLYPQFPERGYYSSPTYWWYRQNMLDLLDAADARLTNCSGAGLLYGERIEEMELEQWLKNVS